MTNPKKRSFGRRILNYTGVAFFVAILLAAIVPFFIPVKPISGLVENRSLATAQSEFVEIPFAGVESLQIHYIQQEPENVEADKAFVLLHGSVFNAFTWEATLQPLSHYGRVIAYDQIPYGLSEKLTQGDWTGDSPYEIDAVVDRLFAFLDAMELENVILVGNSYGAVLAVRAATLHPERIEALVLADAAVFVQEEMPSWLLSLPQVEKLGPLLARSIGQSESFVEQTYTDPDRISDAGMARTLIHTQVNDWEFALWEYLKVWKMPDLSDRIASISQPVLVISGNDDKVVPLADSQKLNDALQNSELVILQDCGHVPQEECPEAFNAAIISWLEGLE